MAGGILLPQEAEGGEIAQQGQHQVLPHGQIGDHTFFPAVLRYHGHAFPDALPGAPGGKGFSGEAHGPFLEGEPAEDGPGKFRPARAHKPGEADDLPPADGKGHVLEPARRRRASFHGKDLFPQCDWALGILPGEVPVDHQADEPLLVHGGSVQCIHLFPVPEDRDPVGQVEHLGKVVRYVEDGQPPGLQVPDEGEEAFALLHAQRGGGLVEDHHFRIPEKHLQDGEHLLPSAAKLGRGGVEIHVHAVFFSEPEGIFPHFPLQEETGRGEFQAEEQVLPP
ncbi:hypothetical protein SDC9_121912 [bioreactor metagenome]|uniref:Uncharacterized protein n=1 Tax=bioreactor metagenome TaxID=1076179 RepID=A0A645CDD6_9ZZZZ